MIEKRLRNSTIKMKLDLIEIFEELKILQKSQKMSLNKVALEMGVSHSLLHQYLRTGGYPVAYKTRYKILNWYSKYKEKEKYLKDPMLAEMISNR